MLLNNRNISDRKYAISDRNFIVWKDCSKKQNEIRCLRLQSNLSQLVLSGINLNQTKPLAI